MHITRTQLTPYVFGILVALCAYAGVAHAQSARVQLAPNVEERIVSISENVAQGATVAIGRFEQISVRIESRIEKLKAAGVTTEVAETRFADAKRALATAQREIALLPDVRTAIAGDTPREAFVDMRLRMQAIRTALAEVRIALGDTLSLLKEAVAQNADSNTGDLSSDTLE